MQSLNHPIVEQSFSIIDQEIGAHSLPLDHYAIVRRIIHSTADFEFRNLVAFSPNVVDEMIIALQSQAPIIVDVNMVKQGIQTLVAKTFKNPIHVAVNHASEPLPGKTRTEIGLMRCLQEYPESIVVIGNAPTALIATCRAIAHTNVKPKCVIGAPVGFVSVLESKNILAHTDIPQIRVDGRKGGSSVAAAIINALLVLAHRADFRS